MLHHELVSALTDLDITEILVQEEHNTVAVCVLKSCCKRTVPSIVSFCCTGIGQSAAIRDHPAFSE